jgi:pantetheine-phosphate adenylyltransferase
MREALVGVYPGTFDPITNGHMDIIAKAIDVVDILIVAVATNTLKIPMFSVDDRIKMIEHDLLSLTDGLPVHKKVIAISLDGLLVDFVRKQKSNLIVRGLRAVSDFEYEFQLSAMNSKLAPDIQTIFLPATEKTQFIASSIVKEVCRLNGNISDFVSAFVESKIVEYYKNRS